MTTAQQFIGMHPWWETPAGRRVMGWEQEWFSAAVTDVFGFHALQLGLPALDALGTNRMPHRWVAMPMGHSICAPGDEARWLEAMNPPTQDPGSLRAHLRCEFDALPFASHSLDLVVMPHALEFARDPHLTLREVERVLVPEGRLMITAFNPARWRGRGPSSRGFSDREGGLGKPLGWPERADMIGFRRLRDWLRLLSFEVETARFGCFGPLLDSPVWQRRWAWVEPVGQRWWPVLGAVYGLMAVKRVRGMRLVGLAKRQARYASAPRPALVRSQRDVLRRNGSSGC